MQGMRGRSHAQVNPALPVIYFTVTNDLTYDQRMIRICTSLSQNGYTVILVGREIRSSVSLIEQPFQQVRLNVLFEKGFMFYAEFNIRLFLFLLGKKMDGVCAIDLDSIIPCYLISRLKKAVPIYDAHELFCEMKEIVSRPLVYKTWKFIERSMVPKFKYGYTVNDLLRKEFYGMYKCDYAVVRSISKYQDEPEIEKKKYILYQGAVNEGRCFEALIPAMRLVKAPLYVCGKGNFFDKAKELAANHGVADKIHFMGLVIPQELRRITNKAYIGITFFESDSRNNYYSLANRFFDYIHGGTPQLCVDYPVYRELNNELQIAVLLNDISAENIAQQINYLLNNTSEWERLHNNCKQAAKFLNWQTEEKKLLSFYKNIFG